MSRFLLPMLPPNGRWRAGLVRLAADTSGVAQIEYIVVFVLVSLPFCLACVPFARDLLSSYLATRELMLYGQP